MVRNLSMLILSIVVAGAMFAIVRGFLRKLVKIEEAMWGEKAREVDRAKKKQKADAS